MPNQYENDANLLAHVRTTGPEIWRQTEGKVTHFVAGLGTCGTICGIAEYIKPKRATFHVVGVEPSAAPMISKGEWSQHGIMGLSPGFVPDNLDRSLVDEIVTVSEEQAYESCRNLAQQEGILVGISSGANAHVASELAKRSEYADKLIACIFPDTGERYFSVKGLFPSA